MTAGTIADIHGLRVTATWLNQDDLHPTYHGLLVKHTTGPGSKFYTGLLTDYPTYADLMNTAGASQDLVEDITCDEFGNGVSGMSITRGRQSIGEPVGAGTLSMTLNDHTGKHDPRRPPSGTSRTGAKIVVEVDPELKGTWFPLFSGFVESWERTVNAGEGNFSEIQVDAADAFSLLGRAVATPPTSGPTVGAGDVGSARIDRLLTEASWIPKWGAKDITASHVVMSPTKLDGGILDAAHDVTTSEDGIFDITPEGAFHWTDRYWRGLRRLRAAVVDITGHGTEEAFPGVPRVCPSGYRTSDDDLDMVNRAIVWRSVETDPDLGDGSRPEPDKRTAQDLFSIDRHGTIANEYSDLPHLDNNWSQSLATAFVNRLAGEANNVGAFEIPLVKRYTDAKVVVGLDWGDQLISWDDTITGTPEPFELEYVGVHHDITPEAWTVTLGVDRWVDSGYLPSLGVVSGTPGHFTPLGATIPADLATLQALGPLGQTGLWPKGHFVWLANGTRAHWNQWAWDLGAYGDPTSVTAGAPGTFNPAGCVIPLDFKVLATLGPLGSTVRWKPSQYVTLADASHAWWDGTQWRVGITPIDATAGAPGTYDPPTATFVSVASLALVRPLPSTPWAAGQYVPLTGPEARAHWNGSAWVVNASPGYGTSPGRWGTTTGKGRWGLSTWKTGP